jgi:hypothetical protein
MDLLGHQVIPLLSKPHHAIPRFPEAPMEGQPQRGAPSSASWYATATVKIRKKIWQQAPDSGFMILDAVRGGLVSACFSACF